MSDAMLGGDTRVAEAAIVVMAVTLLTNRPGNIDQDTDGMSE